MSQENSKIALQLIEAINRRDADAFVAILSPDVEWEDSVFWSEPPRVYRRAEVRGWFNKIMEPWERFHIEVEEITEAADDRVFLGGLLTTRGKGSGVETEVRGCFVLWIADCKITRRQVFLDRDKALQAAGLSEQSVREENVELVRRAFEEVNARLEFPRGLFHPDFELDLTDSGGPVVQGLDAAQETMREYWETFDDFHYEIEEVIHADEEHVVVSVRDGGRMKGSGAEVWTRFFDVVILRGGKIVRLSAYLDRNRALEAVGLSE